jgi:uncharacterized repeat protein (TIGR03803 family)
MGKLSLSKVAWIFMFCTSTVIASPAQTFTTLVSFDGTNGSTSEFPSLVQGANGDLYGTTTDGGANSYGTVFKMTPAGTLTTVLSFDGSNGQNPADGLAQANGSFYGTTQQGGAHGDGTVFKMTSGGTLTTLFSFDGVDGASPYGELAQANGNFYGTTYAGGAHSYGTVFKITPGGTLTTLHSFAGGPSDGASPWAGLTLAKNGNFYGTTVFGGAYGYGTFFTMTPSGTLTTLYSFCILGALGCVDGAWPYAAPLQGTDGNFYGTTPSGGDLSCNPSYGCGTVFQITPAGKLTTLHSFDGSDGTYPFAGLIQGSDGDLYGMTSDGLNGYGGTVFQITTGGTLTTLYAFCSQPPSCADGQHPYGALVQDTNGAFYGLTTDGGADNDGTVFSLSVGLGPFVETLPTSGKVAAAVKILGTNLTGATSVTFNGTVATFTVVSNSEITTTVPAGATTGKVRVTTPAGTLTSNGVFRVIP